MDKKLILKLVKFSIIGFSGILIDYGATFFLKEVLFINKYFANSIGFILAASSNYFLNRIWTFKSTNPQIIKEYSIFLIISIIGLILNNLIIWLLNDYIFNINFYLSKLFAIGIVYVWNFSMNYYYNFK